MATQLRSTRQLSIAGETLDWTEIDPYVWELTFPGGPVIGQIIEIPAHGRSKQTWQRQDTGTRYHSVIVACSDLLTDFYRKQAHHPQLRRPSAEDWDIGTMTPPPAPEPPRLALVPPAPKPERKPLGVPDGWLPKADAAQAYEISLEEMDDWIGAGLVEHVTAGTTVYVPPPDAPSAPTEPGPVIETQQPTKPVLAETIPEGWIKTKDAAIAYGVSVNQISEWARQGTIDSVLVRGMGRNGTVRYVPPPPTSPAPVKVQPTTTQLPLEAPTTTQEEQPPAGWLKGRNAAAKAYGTSEAGIRRRQADGKLTGKFIDGFWYFAPPSISISKVSGPQPEPEQAGRWVTKAEAAKLLGMGISGVQARIDTGTIPARKVNGNVGIKGARWYWEVQLPPEAAPAPRAAFSNPVEIAAQEEQILAYTQQHGIVTRQDCITHLHLTPDQATKRLMTLRRNGRLQIIGGRTQGCYALPLNPEPEAVPNPPPATGPLPEPVALSEFASPTIEVPITAGADDHLLDAGPPPSPAPEYRLLAAMQRIGYLEAQVEHWQAEAERREQKCLQLADKLNNQALLYRTLGSVPREGDPDLAGPIAREPKPRRWFPFSW